MCPSKWVSGGPVEKNPVGTLALIKSVTVSGCVQNGHVEKRFQGFWRLSTRRHFTRQSLQQVLPQQLSRPDRRSQQMPQSGFFRVISAPVSQKVHRLFLDTG